MPAVADQAVCIRVYDWSETSQTVTLFGREQGLVRAVAKGSKREKSAFSGGLEPLSRGEMMAIIKPSSDLATMTAWDLREIFPSLRQTLSSFYNGMYLADLAQHALHERDPHPALFDRLVESLRLLGDEAANRRAVLLFQWAVLVEGGYRPELHIDVAAGEPLAPAKTYGFCPPLGGFVADSAEPAYGRPSPVWRVRAETLNLLRALAAAPSDATLASQPEDDVDRASRLLAAHLREVLGRDLPSMRHLFGELRP